VARPDSPLDSEDVTFEISVHTEGQPWGTCTVSVREGSAETVVDVEWSSDRRFGLRRLPQWLVAERYREEILAAQGYTLRTRDSRLST